MKNYYKTCLVFILSIFNLGAQAEFLDIAKQPLQTTGSSLVLPNLMFVLDDSGSMAWDFTPDWAQTDPADSRYQAPDWYYNNADYNSQYYNPDVTYIAPVDYKGVTLGNQTSFTAVENDVTETGASKGGTTNLVNSAKYFAYVPGEYCTTSNLKSCITTNVATATQKYPAALRWCNSSAAAIATSLTGSQVCQAIRNDTAGFSYLRQPLATYKITFTKSGVANTTVSSIKINNMELLKVAVSSTTASGIATVIKNNICVSTDVSGNCDLARNVVTSSGSSVTIKTYAGQPINGVTNAVIVTASDTSLTSTTTLDSTTIAGSLMMQKIVSTQNSYTSPGKTVKAIDRSDCSSNVCNYTEEMTNYANWWAYYRTRMQSMKTAASLAFKSMDYRYRIGFSSINVKNSGYPNYYLAISAFDTTQKQTWYQTLYSATPGPSTPLRTALASVGRHFAGKKTLGNDDPVQFACQQNFTLLTTDGYWNDSNSGAKDINGQTITNQDSGATPRPLFDALAKSPTLADTSKYYNDTDIRNSKFSNCTNNGVDVCGTETDNPKQSMTTLTLGLGIDGTMVYTDDYKMQTVGDFADLVTGAKDWSDPIANTQGERIDDLWHAAVNGGGTYYSARNPKLLRESLVKGLAEIKTVVGSGSAAAASSLSPVDGDNYQYVASYQTVKWIGNLESRTINLNNYSTSESATWCAESVASETCATPSVQTTVTANGSTRLYCKTASSDTTTCSSSGGTMGVGGEASSCYVEVPSKCVGTLQAQVANGTRNIFFNNNNTLTNFNVSSLPAVHKQALESGYLSLSQMQGLLATDPKITETNKAGKLVDYLRGNKTYEDSGVNSVEGNRLFRERQATLGDITQSRPAFFRKNIASYTDPGFQAFNEANVSRTPVVYVGANDGMMHAFNATTGQELWAFIPTPVIKNLPNLADKEYGSNYHTNYVNGNPVIDDICIASCDSASAVWKTILVSGLNGGGRGYFAIDVTTPQSPSLLWEFTSDNNFNLGLSYGNPVVTKLNDGRWVVLVSSGYNNGTYAQKNADGTYVNNTPQGDGKGYLYVLDAKTGAVIKTLTTNEGSLTNPSGLAKIATQVPDMFTNNKATYAYGGDLNGNVWRFDINQGVVSKIATLTDAGGVPQKITTMPDIGEINKTRVVIVGTGKFLEVSDLQNTPTNSVYVFKDKDTAVTISRSSLVRQIMSSSRVVTTSPVDFTAGNGWYMDFPASGERVNIDPLLADGVLRMPTLVPSSTSCSGAGYGYMNTLNYKTGGGALASGLASTKYNAPIVGFNVMRDANGNLRTSVTTSDDPTPTLLPNEKYTNFGSSTGNSVLDKNTDGSYGTKHSWHELLIDQ